ncbi:GMC family oxidoreductase [Pseudomonas typographi]|uniref:GMC family oxidoreductase n=1 Tax=Pseudomonas typographi TaxID=2715964 RepID=A0ABR7Z3I9_9PSED|nr:GMC family oxidoreductase [Pseudomonas typographi]MBD1599987.1 GMC family oxidoreductase [Pseudomonas typographi]
MRTHKEVDVVIIGMGWTGGIIAKELAQAGLHVVGLERGGSHTTQEDFAVPWIRDELRYSVRNELMQDLTRTTVTVRNNVNERALPMRKLGSFLPGEGVGGSGIHWGGLSLRWTDQEFKLKSMTEQRYGKAQPSDGLLIQDWGISYDELEPYYEKFEYMAGVSGVAHNVGQRRAVGAGPAGGNPFEAARRRGYPLPALDTGLAGELFNAAASSLGYHPYVTPMARASQAYVNPDGVAFGECQYCGFCGGYGCEVNAKGSPHHTMIPLAQREANFELRTHAWVSKITQDAGSKRATGVEYTNLASGQTHFQPAAVVVLASYALGNVHLMLLSGIDTPYDPVSGNGVVGRNYAYQAGTGVALFFENQLFNPYMNGGLTSLDDFNANADFDRSQIGAIGGSVLYAGASQGLPIGARALPQGSSLWGSAWKQQTTQWFPRTMTIAAHSSTMANRWNYLDLDPTYRDALGQPLLRMTFDYSENERKLTRHSAGILNQIAAQLNPTHRTQAKAAQSWSVEHYQSTHNTGGTIMGADPHTSVVNKYGQAWALDNLFIAGASVFPHDAAYPPTLLVSSLAYHTADAIKLRYARHQRGLV